MSQNLVEGIWPDDHQPEELRIGAFPRERF